MFHTGKQQPLFSHFLFKKRNPYNDRNVCSHRAHPAWQRPRARTHARRGGVDSIGEEFARWPFARVFVG